MASRRRPVIRLKPRPENQRGIPAAQYTIPALVQSVEALREMVELILRQRGTEEESAARVGELRESEENMDRRKSDAGHEHEIGDVAELGERLRRIEHALFGNPNISWDRGIMAYLWGDDYGLQWGDLNQANWQRNDIWGWNHPLLGLLGMLYGHPNNSADTGMDPWKYVVAQEGGEENMEVSLNEWGHVVFGPPQPGEKAGYDIDPGEPRSPGYESRLQAVPEATTTPPP